VNPVGQTVETVGTVGTVGTTLDIDYLGQYAARMGRTSHELLHGTLDTLILKALEDEPRHGYGIVRQVGEATDNAVVVEDGSLYPALYRLEKQGLIRGDWGVSELGRRARFYRLTPKGVRGLAARTKTWEQFAAGVSRLLLGRRP
jgi:transcriptional regulator